ncbi:MAG: site-specific tyrosine recombinase XerD [Lentisphaerae bacterium]|nr:site-specific tyrosine recombinase XerD [Lentisphaerota bacterium]
MFGRQPTFCQGFGKEKSINVLVDQFLDYVSLERGLSNNTREAYSADLRSFCDFLESVRIRSFNAVTRKHVLDYLVAEKKRGLSVNSISRRLVAVKIFFSYLEREGLLDSNVTSSMDSPKLWKILPTTLSIKEVGRLLDSPIGDTKIAIRDKALLELLYATGLRVSEIADLRLDDIHFDSGYLRTRGKGSKVRVVPFGEHAQRHVLRYLDEARARFSGDNASPHVFLTYRGKKFSRKGIWKLVKNHAARAGIQKDVSPHTIRHSFASHMLANNAPLRVIQEMLGHADIATTQIYTHIDKGRLRSVHAQFHPRA